MEKQGSAGFFGGPNFDAQVFVPITAFAQAFGGAERNIDIAVKAPSTEALADFEYEVIGEMRNVRRLSPAEKDDFSINKMDTLVAMFNNVMGVVLLIGMIITGISLFVGGVGVMNIMFVSVTERTREIGIRKAIGATRGNVLVQFLTEATILSVLGGLIGIALGAGIARLISGLNLGSSPLHPMVAPDSVLLATLFALAVGLFFGIYPAYRASSLNPIDALRYE
jgi:putative ABC transport system permease protein